MNEKESSITASGRTRWQQAALEGVIALVALLAILVGALAGLEAFGDDDVTSTVNLEDSAEAAIEPNRADGYRLELDQGELVIEDPSIADRVAAASPAILGAIVVGTVAWLLYEVATSLRTGDPFVRANAKRLRWAAGVALVGGMGASLAGSLSAIYLASGATDDLPIDPSATLSLLPLPAGFVLLAIAEIFRHGANLRDDVEGLV
jgi:Protein of unknown function (DUF2975)